MCSPKASDFLSLSHKLLKGTQWIISSSLTLLDTVDTSPIALH